MEMLKLTDEQRIVKALNEQKGSMVKLHLNQATVDA